MTQDEKQYIFNSAMIMLHLGCNTNENVIRRSFDSQMEDVRYLNCTQKEELYQIVLRIMCNDKDIVTQEKIIIKEVEDFLEKL